MGDLLLLVFTSYSKQRTKLIQHFLSPLWPQRRQTQVVGHRLSDIQLYIVYYVSLIMYWPCRACGPARAGWGCRRCAPTAAVRCTWTGGRCRTGKTLALKFYLYTVKVIYLNWTGCWLFWNKIKTQITGLVYLHCWGLKSWQNRFLCNRQWSILVYTVYEIKLAL